MASRKSLEWKWSMFKQDLDRTRGNSPQALLGRAFDWMEREDLKKHILQVHKELAACVKELQGISVENQARKWKAFMAEKLELEHDLMVLQQAHDELTRQMKLDKQQARATRASSWSVKPALKRISSLSLVARPGPQPSDRLPSPVSSLSSGDSLGATPGLARSPQIKSILKLTKSASCTNMARFHDEHRAKPHQI
ncbi:hypothetical protein HDV03_002414 [Kappamyces sp. JEL0829]|nr:hypothetical protein HDV03_002414 [Kappamyces sp. JEL0829]